VDIQPLADMLEELLQAWGDPGSELCLAESPPGLVGDLGALQEEYTSRYERAVASVQELRGQAAFAGGPSEPGYPSGLRCEHVTYWKVPAGIIYVGLLTASERMMVVGGARPSIHARDMTTLLPPSD
jgi:hypothetical protein